MQQDLFLNSQENLLPFQGEVRFYPHFFESTQADELMRSFQESLAWRQEPIRIFGREIMQPRLTALYGEAGMPYGYSGIEMIPLPWTPELMAVKTKIEEFTQLRFTHVLCNYYRNGQDSMGWHRDNEQVLGQNPSIASMTFGASRKFQLRHYTQKSIKRDVVLSHGSLLIMQGESQHFWEHQLPKSSKILGPRINLTFRKLIR